MDLSGLVVGVVGMTALCMKAIDFVKLCTNWSEQRRAVVTQLLAWLAAVAVVFLYSLSDFGHSVVIGGIAVNNMAWATKVILGFAIGSAGSVTIDFKKAIDGSDTAKVPSLKI